MKSNEDNAIEVLNKNGMRLSKGDSHIELSPELSAQVCTKMISLGEQLISETRRITVEYFRTQTEMYFGELKAYIETQQLYSSERREILSMLEDVTRDYSRLIAEAPDKRTRKELIKYYKILSKDKSKLYLEALKADKRPQRPSLFRGTKRYDELRKLK